MPRVLLLLPTADYRAEDFLAAARRSASRWWSASDRRQTLRSDGRPALGSTCAGPTGPPTRSSSSRATAPLDAVVAVDDGGVVAAAIAARRGSACRHNPPDAVAPARATRLAHAAGARGGRGPPARASPRSPTRRATWPPSGSRPSLKPVGLVGEPRRHPRRRRRAARARPSAGSARSWRRRRRPGGAAARSRSTCPASRSPSRGCCATASSRCSRSSTSPIRSRARTSRRRSTSRRRACRPTRCAAVEAARRDGGAARSGCARGRCTPSCGSTATRCG